MKDLIRNRKAQETTGTIAEDIVEYLPWIILFAVLVIAVFLLKNKLGIT